MPSEATSPHQAGPRGGTGRRLVVAIADTVLRHWITSEFNHAWPGPIDVVSPQDQFIKVFPEHEPDAVLVICGPNLSAVTKQYGRRWERLSTRVTVVLVESSDNMDLIRTHFPYVDAVLVHDAHMGMAVDIVRSAKSGVRGYPVPLVEQMLARPQRGPESHRTSRNGATPPSALTTTPVEGPRQYEATFLPPQDAGQAPARPPGTGLVGSLLSRLKRRWAQWIGMMRRRGGE